MPQAKNDSHFYDMGGMSAKELVARKLTEFTRQDLFIGIPAKITKVSDYENLQCVDVQPVFEEVDIDEQISTAVTLKKIFVKLPAGGGFSIKIPLKVGDIVTVQYSHKSLAKWLDSAGDSLVALELLESLPELRDCWVEPGFGTRRVNQKPSATDFIIEGDNTTVTITPDGKVSCVTTGDVDVETTANATIKCAAATVDAPESTFTGNVTIQGTLTVDLTATITGGISAPTYNGLGGSGGTMTVDNVVANVNVTVNGKSVDGHDHSGTVTPF